MFFPQGQFQAGQGQVLSRPGRKVNPGGEAVIDLDEVVSPGDRFPDELHLQRPHPPELLKETAGDLGEVRLLDRNPGPGCSAIVLDYLFHGHDADGPVLRVGQAGHAIFLSMNGPLEDNRSPPGFGQRIKIHPGLQEGVRLVSIPQRALQDQREAQIISMMKEIAPGMDDG